MSRKPELTREEEAVEEMSRTSVAPLCSAVLITLFVVALFAVPVVQSADDWMQSRRGRRADAVPEWARLEPLGTSARRAFTAEQGSWFARLTAANRALLREMGRYETRLEDSSWLAKTVAPPVQYLFTRRLGIGNENVCCGEDGELFYRPDVDFVTAPGFLDPARMRARLLENPEARPVQPDPVAAIRAFHRDLKAMGIRLIVMPVPAKPTLHAAGLYKEYPSDAPLPQNPSYRSFIETLRRDGVDVFDCTAQLASGNRSAYLKQDTHWLPSAVEESAEALAGHIRALNLLPERRPVGYTRRSVEAGNKGDIAAMLRFPANEDLYAMERVKIQQVIGPDQRLWERPERADVLVLGDSFANIYSLPSLNWGTAAGLVEQLSYSLQRPVARITLNDKGSYATRQELARRQSAGERPLDGVRVVVWEFAVRELAQGDWKTISVFSPAERGAEW